MRLRVELVSLDLHLALGLRKRLTELVGLHLNLALGLADCLRVELMGLDRDLACCLAESLCLQHVCLHLCLTGGLADGLGMELVGGDFLDHDRIDELTSDLGHHHRDG